METGDFKKRVFKNKREKEKECGSHQKGNGKMDDHGVRMASCHWKLLEKLLKYERKVFQFLRGPLLQNSNLWIPFKDFWPMRSGRNRSCKIASRGMSVHVKAFGPERAFGHIKISSKK
jgi:hypothetical protein